MKHDNRTPSTQLNIAVPLVNNMISTSITLPLEMMEAASTYSQMEGNKKLLNVNFYAETRTAIKAAGGLLLHPDTSYDETSNADLVLVPALWRNPITQIRKNINLISWLRKQHENNALISVGGTGVVFLAEAGLLNNQPAATHWFYLQKLQQHYPNIDFKPHHLITHSGRIYCAGSVNSVADIMVHIIKIVMGASVAIRVEQQFSHEIRKSFEETSFTMIGTTPHKDEAIVLLQEWLNNNYQQDISISDMSRISSLHYRTLGRRFRKATNYSPMTYLKRLRLRQSIDLLKNSNLSIHEIANSVGYNHPEYFSRSFYKQYKLTPTDYRKSVREKLFRLYD